MNGLSVIFRRELKGYFDTPVAYVFLFVFLVLSGIFTFYLGNFFEIGIADLNPFFMWHPWLYLFLIPAISMRLWAEERKNSTLELLMTLPVPVWQAVLGKYLAAWAFAAIALFLTVPIWITVNFLGNPDNGVIVTSYISSLLIAGGFLAIGSCISALTRNQVIAFVISVFVCFAFMVSGFPIILDLFTWLGFPQIMVDTISNFSFVAHFDEMTKGVISLKNITYFTTLIAVWLYVNNLILTNKR